MSFYLNTRMIHCDIIGDSLAVGTSWFLPECTSEAKIGLSIDYTYKHYTYTNADYTIISLGTNQGPNEEKDLTNLRSEISGKVIWLLPPGRLRDLIKRIGQGDIIIDIRDAGGTPAEPHPGMNGYKFLATQVRNAMS